MIGDPSNNKRFAFVRQAIERSCPEAWTNARVLDLGCGPGALEVYLGELGCRSVCGVDFDPHLVAAARVRASEYGHDFHAASIEDFFRQPEARGPWDAIVLSEVITHLADPTATLRGVRELLGETGSLVVTIPNGYGPWELYHRFSDRSTYRQPNAPPDGKRLTQRFRRRDLVRLMSDLGFELQDFRRSNFVSGVYPFNLAGYRSLDFVEQFDCWLADRLPAAMVSGWYFAFTHAATTTAAAPGPRSPLPGRVRAALG